MNYCSNCFTVISSDKCLSCPDSVLLDISNSDVIEMLAQEDNRKIDKLLNRYLLLLSPISVVGFIVGWIFIGGPPVGLPGMLLGLLVGGGINYTLARAVQHKFPPKKLHYYSISRYVPEMKKLVNLPVKHANGDAVFPSKEFKMSKKIGKRNFINRLFDISFEDFILIDIIGTIYVVIIIILLLSSLVSSYLVGSGVAKVLAHGESSRDIIRIMSTVIVFPFIFIPSLIFYRIILELFASLARIAQNTTDMVRILAERSWGTEEEEQRPAAEEPPNDLLERARWLHSRGRSEEALLALKDKLRMEPESMSALSLAAVMYEQKRDYQNLLQVLEKQTAIEPGNVKLMEKMAQVMKMANRT